MEAAPKPGVVPNSGLLDVFCIGGVAVAPKAGALLKENAGACSAAGQRGMQVLVASMPPAAAAKQPAANSCWDDGVRAGQATAVLRCSLTEAPGVCPKLKAMRCGLWVEHFAKSERSQIWGEGRQGRRRQRVLGNVHGAMKQWPALFTGTAPPASLPLYSRRPAAATSGQGGRSCSFYGIWRSFFIFVVTPAY